MSRGVVGNVAARTGLVLDHDLLAPDFRQASGDNAGGGIRAATGREADDQADDPIGPRGLRKYDLRERRHRERRRAKAQKMSPLNFHDAALVQLPGELYRLSTGLEQRDELPPRPNVNLRWHRTKR